MRKVSNGYFKDGFTLVELLISVVVFVFVFTGLYALSSRAMVMLDSSRQQARAVDISLANIEYLRTRSWEQLVFHTNASSGDSLAISSNLIVSQDVPYKLCTYVELHPSDPMHIFLTAPQGERPSREIILKFYPSDEAVTTAGAATNSVIRATVVTSWTTLGGQRMTNTMTTLIAKAGMSAHYMGLTEAEVDALGQMSNP